MSWLIYTKDEDDFKSSTTLKKYFNVLFFFLIFKNKAFMKQGYLAQIIGEIPKNSLCINVSRKF